MAEILREVPNHFSLPRRITRLSELAYNLWWAWNPDAARLYSQIDRILWEKVYHNPVAFLRRVERAHLNAATNDRYYLEAYDRVMRDFDQYMTTEGTWFRENHARQTKHQIAYFSFEFGLHESLPVYAGGRLGDDLFVRTEQRAAVHEAREQERSSLHRHAGFILR